MSTSRKMGAGLAGSSKSIHLNGNVGGGDKLQGLVSSVGKSYNVDYRKSYGQNRNVVFYMNQLGGIGKSRSMFATNADGVHIPIKEFFEPAGPTGLTGGAGDTGAAVQSFTVTNSDAGAYLINNRFNPTLYLTRGRTYTFVMDALGHRLLILTGLPYHPSRIYSSGVTNSDINKGVITFTVPLDAPRELYYMSQLNTSVQGSIMISNTETAYTPVDSDDFKQGLLYYFNNSNTSAINILTNTYNHTNLSLIGNFNDSNAKYNISDWLTLNVKDMSSAFKNQHDFNIDISDWDVSGVTTMNSMFENAYTYNMPLNYWNTSNVTNMSSMFAYAYDFNGYINTDTKFNSWNVSNVTDMSYMFLNAYDFNQFLGDWDVSKVNTMESIFYNSKSYNMSIFNWELSNVKNADLMFASAQNYDQQDIQYLNFNSNVQCLNMFYSATKLIKLYNPLDDPNNSFGYSGNNYTPSKEFFNQ